MRFSSAKQRTDARERHRLARATAQLLRSAYPQFGSLRLEFDFTDQNPEASRPAPHLLVMHPPSRAYFVFPCPHADCDGEFDLTTEVAALAGSQESHAIGSRKCGGHRIPDKNGRAACQLTLEYTIVPAAPTP